jgi:hypothetical protein
VSIGSNKWKLPLENHIHLALAATSILLLSRDQNNNDLQPTFSQANIKATIDHIDDMYSIKRPNMDMIRILEDFTTVVSRRMTY